MLVLIAIPYSYSHTFLIVVQFVNVSNTLTGTTVPETTAFILS